MNWSRLIRRIPWTVILFGVLLLVIFILIVSRRNPNNAAPEETDGGGLFSDAATESPATTPTPEIIGGPGFKAYEFVVEIRSGTLEGNTYRGALSYNPSLLSNSGGERLTVVRFAFCYLGVLYSRRDTSSLPFVYFNDGTFDRVEALGNIEGQRFGLNTGYGRERFDRPEELFIQQGEQFFGYMEDNDVVVDGAGTVRYQEIPDGETASIPQCGE